MTTMNYIGLDVHKKTISYCVKDVSGRIQQEGKVGSTRRELDCWMKTLRQPWTVAMEATIFSGWIYDHLLPHATQIKVAHPLTLRAIAAAKKKNDQEYFPADYARMQQYVAAGRWSPAGSSVEEGDVNLPSAEGIFRQILYGNEYFRKDFGKASAEYMLPDCFGFPASLPSILAHAGVKGFSTQKLNAQWQPAPKIGGPDSPEKTPEGIPFNVGMWVGPDGKGVIAALNPGGYGSNVYTDITQEPTQTASTTGPQMTSEDRARLTPQTASPIRPQR